MSGGGSMFQMIKQAIRLTATVGADTLAHTGPE